MIFINQIQSVNADNLKLNNVVLYNKILYRVIVVNKYLGVVQLSHLKHYKSIAVSLKK